MSSVPPRMREQIGALFYLCAIGLVAAILLGGGTHGGFLSDAILQFISVPILLTALWRLGNGSLTREQHGAVWFCVAIAAIPLSQMIPLPPSIWSALPGHSALVTSFELIKSVLPWAPISLSPEATWLSFLSLLPTFAIFLGVLQLDYNERRLLSLITIVMGFISVLVGLIQVAEGPSSPLRFFEVTNSLDAVGFFANKNHFAALLYTLTLLAAAWAGNNGVAFGLEKNRTKFSTASIVSQLASFSVLAVLIGAQVVTRSRAGMGLTVGALLGSFLLVQQAQRSTNGVRPIWLMIGAASLALVLSLQFSMFRAMERFAADTSQDARLAFARNTTEGAKTFMPFGAGVGSFVPVYPMFEKPQDLLMDGYVNHAHNDYLEIWLETGIFGPILIGAYGVWLIWRSAQVWRPSYRGGLDIDRFLVRAATLAIALLLIHSMVDYSLRTGAMMAVFAFLNALLIRPDHPSRTGAREGQMVARGSQNPRPRSKTRTAPAPPARGAPTFSSARAEFPSPRPSRPRPVSADEDEHWPTQWRKSLAEPPADDESTRSSDPPSRE
ncbi:MAG: O-antigen ligase family protein [Methylocystis sp.]